MSIDLLWRGALAVIPLAIVVAIVCWWMPCRPSTRHTLWLIVLGFFAAAPFIPRVPIPQIAALSLTAADAEVGPQSLPSSRTLRSPGEDASRRRSTHRADVLPQGLPATAPARAAEIRADSALESKTTFVESDRSTAPGTPPNGESVLPATATTSRVPHIPGVAPSVHNSPSPSAASAGDNLPNREQHAVSRAEPVPTELSRWIQYAAGVRDVVMGLPPIPALVWIGGIVLLLIVAGLRIGRSVQLVRVATLAPPSVVNMVAAASTHLALRRSPLTLMTDRAISPMLWCGRHVYLILPRQLWEQLDEVGRQAVVYHELAHLRRRDHWVCWAELIIGGLYWWNPVVWFVRLRLREEADLCCDAWVTALLPTGRRAYAQALLDTRKHTSVTQPAMPSVGLGVTTKRAKRFARRLTMVMTEHVRPRLSIRGLALACALAVGGFIVTPLWACPPSERAPQPPKPVKLRAIQVPRAPRPPAATQSDRDQTTFEQFMKSRRGSAVQERINELERQLERLQKELQQRSRSGIRGRRAPQDRSRTRIEVRPAPGPKARVRKSRAGLGRIEAPSVDANIQFVPDVKRPSGLVLAAPPAPQAPPSSLTFTTAPLARLRLTEALQSAAIAGGGDACCEKVVTKTYKLSKGKLEAITELMRRDDVPILIRPGDDSIEVYGNQAQHMIFGAFVKMIDGEDQVESYQLSEGKLGALTELMARDDVPILIEPGDDSITVHGNDLEQAIFGAFVKMISEATKVSQASDAVPSADASSRRWADVAAQYEKQATEAYRQGIKQWAEAAEQFEGKAGHAYSDSVKKWAELAEQYEGQGAYTKQIEAMLKAVEGQVSKATEQAARMAAQSLRVEEWAEVLSEKAEQIEEEASELEDDDDRGRLLRKIEQIIRQVEAMLRQAEALQDEADTAEDQADALRDHADEIREEIENLHETEVASKRR
ncbi:MAG: M56 family metallopeptidase [Phycisphaerales bacterium]